MSGSATQQGWRGHTVKQLKGPFRRSAAVLIRGQLQAFVYRA
jgi:hypothetical protein